MSNLLAQLKISQTDLQKQINEVQKQAEIRSKEILYLMEELKPNPPVGSFDPNLVEN